MKKRSVKANEEMLKSKQEQEIVDQKADDEDEETTSGHYRQVD